MEGFARRPAEEREEVFEETAARLGLGRAAIIEKDFWVCWTLLQLGELFEASEEGAGQRPGGRPHLLFKGGTSLSKVYGAIRRFSEDVDLTVAREALGFTVQEDPSTISQSQQRKLLDELTSECARYVSSSILRLLQDRLDDTVGAQTGVLRTARAHQARVEVTSDDPQALQLLYPRALPADAYPDGAYVKAQIRLEFGARGAMWPAHRATVTPYAAEAFPDLFTERNAHVHVLDLSRTLWEKATILHEIAHTGKVRIGSRVSRHYYDLTRLAEREDGRRALGDFELLAEVAQHKATFFKRSSARYDLARPGSLRLLPSHELLGDIRQDYLNMREMFFESPPAFDEIVESLRSLEDQINS